MKKLILNFKSKDSKKIKNPKNFLGSKGANLSEMGRMGLPVPPGFTISTNVCELFYKENKKLNKNIISKIKKELKVIEKYVSKKFAISQGGLSAESIKMALVKHHIADELISEYLELVEYLERCKYSPHQGDKINKDLYVRSLDLIKKIDMQK